MTNDHHTGSPLSDTKSKQDKAPALGAAKAGKGKSLGRIDVGFNLMRTRLLDPDNAFGSVKDLLDGLRRARLIPDDSSQVIRLAVSQTKVKTRKEEKTIISITYP
jgi:Holliday junction resolvase RusA-like endonuclease